VHKVLERAAQSIIDYCLLIIFNVFPIIIYQLSIINYSSILRARDYAGKERACPEVFARSGLSLNRRAVNCG